MSEQCSTVFERSASVFRVDLSVLARLVPAGLVQELLAAAGVVSRTRRTSAVLGVYLVSALTLFPQVSTVGVFEKLTGAAGRPGREVPGRASLKERRAGLGTEVFRLLFDRLRGAGAPAGGAWFAGLLVCAWDGTMLEAPDSPGNAGLGKMGNQKGKGAFPQVRLLVLVACGSRALIDAAFDAMGVGETALAGRVLGSLRCGMLLLADRNFTSWLLWCQAAGTGADLLWRMPAGVRLDVHEVLPDGSGLAWRHAPGSVRKADRAGWPGRVLVRVVCGFVTVTDEHGVVRSEPYRLITTLLDPAAHPAATLVALYARRWQVELTIKGLKCVQRGDRRQLRSKTHAGVVQEVWAYLCTHQLLRLETARAAQAAGADIAQISFTSAVQRLRDAVVRTGGRRGAKTELARLRRATTADVTPKDARVRIYRREVKHPVSHWPAKRGRTSGQIVTIGYTVEPAKINR